MTFTAHVEILPHPELLDPQGKAVLLGLSNLNITSIEDVRVGKHIVLSIEAGSMQEADALAKEACEKLLVNPIMERYSYEVTEG
ncbi:MAG: phosphoribosylformylglycinamidine synthase subunit PurS [Bacteroidota bacterium]|nr:phosphoribosylformylglycinamidine synthase subunit PurS [Bacteroidota bacterium]